MSDPKAYRLARRGYWIMAGCLLWNESTVLTAHSIVLIGVGYLGIFASAYAMVIHWHWARRSR